jgi:hypothetical protein
MKISTSLALAASFCIHVEGAKVVGSVFNGPGQDGDFRWMISRPEHARSLFVFNDNEEQFEAFLGGERRSGCAAGGGNAAIRPYQCHDPRKAAGIPTGSHSGGGYESLTDHAKAKIDRSIEEIRRLLDTGLYDTVYISKARDTDTLGTGIFRVGDDVKDYIYQLVLSLSD